MSKDCIILIVEYVLVIIFFLRCNYRLINLPIIVFYSIYGWYQIKYYSYGGNSLVTIFYAFFFPIIHVLIYLLIIWIVSMIDKNK